MNKIVNCCRTASLQVCRYHPFLFRSLKTLPKFPVILPRFRQFTTLAINTSNEKKLKYVGLWLLGCSALVATTVSVGGLTRLTESGLSMVDWKFAGRRAPSTEAEWVIEWEKYQDSPQYKYHVVHQGMTMTQFKFIWYMEWGHRQLGRVIGLCVIIPSLALATRKWVPKPIKARLAGFTSLVVCQGLLGWYMVKSGLKDMPDNHDVPRVSQYRLASHLGAAFVLYLSMVKTSLDLVLPAVGSGGQAVGRVRMWAGGVAGLTFLTAISGAFVAGLDAGLVYNSYPKFADRWVPEDILSFAPTWRNFFENTTTVQFNHRALAHCTILGITTLFLVARPLILPRRAKLALNALMAMGWLQVSMGVSTLLLHVPTWLAACHQQGSLILLTLTLWLHHELKPATALKAVKKIIK